MNRDNVSFGGARTAVALGAALLLMGPVVAMPVAGADASVSPAPAAGPGADARRPKRLIAVGWDLFSDTKWLRDHRDAMEQPPFDGIVLNVVGRRDDGKEQPLRLAFSRQEWKEAWFAGAVEDLKALRSWRLTDNFAMVWANPGDVDWFDDAGWAAIVDHFRVAARVARQGGLKGIAFDPEPYHEPYAPFKYAAQKDRDRRPFAEVAAKVRERGRQVMQAVAAEYPDITVLSFFLNGINGGATGRADPRPLLAGAGYGLLPAFLDGWLDAAPPMITLVDGHEGSYCYNSDAAYLEAANLIRGACQELVSPENRARYRAQVQVGFGVYLDAYVNPPTSQWYVDGLGGPRVDRLRANVAAAVRCSDQYVWVYGEKCRWWPTPNKGVTERTWPEALPGCDDALRFARDPVAWALASVAKRREAGTLANLLTNGDFSARWLRAEPAAGAAGRLPDAWSTWQDDKSKGTFAWDSEVGAAAKGSARMAGMADGCFLQKVKVEPGRRFLVQGVRRQQGRGEALVLVRWQTADEKWVAEQHDVPLVSADARDAWGCMAGVVQVPAGAGRLVVLLLARGQASADDVAWFDDVAVYALD